MGAGWTCFVASMTNEVEREGCCRIYRFPFRPFGMLNHGKVC